MKALFVYQQASYKLGGQIEYWQSSGRTVETIAGGAQVLAPGLYRLDDAVVAELQDQADAELVVAPQDKTNWPDPPRLNKLGAVGVTKPDIVGFLGGTGAKTVMR